MTRHNIDAAVRFWAYVDKTPTCWLWTGAAHRSGYGRFQSSNYSEPKIICQAHRFSYELANGPITDGLWVLHRCDVPACVRPEHLFLGTQSDNMQDAVTKGRHRCGHQSGEDHPHAKLTAKQVAEMRQLRSDGALLKPLALKFGVGTSQVYRIVTGLSWSES